MVKSFLAAGLVGGLILLPSQAQAQFFSSFLQQDAEAWAGSRTSALQVAGAVRETEEPAAAESTPGPGFEDRFAKGQYEFGITLGYGENFNLAPIDSPSDIRTQIRFAYVFPNFKYNLTGLVGKSFYRGAWYWMIEAGVAFTVVDPEQAGQPVDQAPTYLIGLVPLQLEYKFLNPERDWAPFFFLGAGVSWGDWSESTRELATVFEFILQFGAGLEYFLDNGTALNFNYRFWHLSNSNIKNPNIGINAHVFSLGYSF